MTDDLVCCDAFLGGKKLLPKSRLHHRPCVYGLVLHEDQLLVVNLRRSDKFALPGGGVDIGERLEDAMRRELREETGIEVAVEGVVGFAESFFYYDPADLACHAFLFFCACTPTTFDLLSNDKIEDAEAIDPHWVSIENLRPEHFQTHGDLILQLVAPLRQAHRDQGRL